jgi:transposase-like protein
MYYAHCPHCRSIEFRNVGFRNQFEKAIAWLVSPFRCLLCGRHFFLFRWLAPLRAGMGSDS